MCGLQEKSFKKPAGLDFELNVVWGRFLSCVVVILSGPGDLLLGRYLITFSIIAGEQDGCETESDRIDFMWIILRSISWGVLIVCGRVYILEVAC